jgi:hypothetical protein
MPKILTRLTSQLQAKGMSPGEARAVATKTLQKAGDLKPGTNQATAKGIQRGDMGAAGRAKDRAAKKSTHPTTDYTYSAKTNRATLKGKNNG